MDTHTCRIRCRSIVVAGRSGASSLAPWCSAPAQTGDVDHENSLLSIGSAVECWFSCGPMGVLVGLQGRLVCADRQTPPPQWASTWSLVEYAAPGSEDTRAIRSRMGTIHNMLTLAGGWRRANGDGWMQLQWGLGMSRYRVPRQVPAHPFTHPAPPTAATRPSFRAYTGHAARLAQIGRYKPSPVHCPTFPHIEFAGRKGSVFPREETPNAIKKKNIW
ncbi:hypothetical protein PSV09DRAFT_2255487 [Bipolaris maydis]|uniref:uncharacterized protein n=1 Tax=Cochliobolus heterostrophus TaxID=5016 RepID=UPI0024DC22DD|nr:hypothetical protein J3E73DRAFT_260532 [Bipolaris maydis]KAJ5055965.1 hypothetical protein J3E74DRAFT_294338 [Bipolaris maydis]KAJ6212164.1 hypothetical protein PSV09DRAFT_2255487 [Bipolaris maydis]KAJ6266925.1 hypothetical protein PSV08DRAFT_250987 [Bipolaris maydis]KAJ6277543.1 hypothetical protein J3E71DRAFT_244609 [Bipolaris maydis]